MQQIADWLEKLGMSEYGQRFAENRIDLSVLPDLTDQDLEKLGVVLGDRRKMLRAIANLDNAQPAVASAPAASGIHEPSECGKFQREHHLDVCRAELRARHMAAARGLVAGTAPRHPCSRHRRRRRHPCPPLGGKQAGPASGRGNRAIWHADDHSFTALIPLKRRCGGRDGWPK